MLMLTVLSAGPAWAHVTVHPDTTPAGSSDIELTFRVPNERDDANTVELQVYLPANLPLLTVDVLPVPGWTAMVGTRTLSTPVQTDDGPVDQVVTDIAWTAAAGGIAPGQYQDFAISVGQLPGQAGQIIFKSLQTYSSGEVVRWIQVATPVYPDPATSAPILTLTNPTPASVATTTSGSSGTTEALAVAALAVAVLALLGVVLLLIRGRRRGDSGAAG